MFEVRTPVPGVTEVIAGVSFMDGVAQCDTGPALAYFRMAGYHIDDLDMEAAIARAAKPEASEVPPQSAETGGPEGGTGDGDDPSGVERPKGNASTDAWRAYAIAHGMAADEAANLNRDEIVARYPEENK